MTVNCERDCDDCEFCGMCDAIQVLEYKSRNARWPPHSSINFVDNDAGSSIQYYHNKEIYGWCSRYL